MLYFIDYPTTHNPNWLLLITEMVSGLTISFLGCRLWKHLTPMISYVCAFGVSSWLLFDLRKMDPNVSDETIFATSVILGILYTLSSLLNDQIGTIAMLQFVLGFSLNLTVGLVGVELSNVLRIIIALIFLATSSLLGVLAITKSNSKKAGLILNVLLTSMVGSLLFVIGLSWVVAAFDSNSLPLSLAIQEHPMPQPNLSMTLQFILGGLLFCITSFLQYYCFVKNPTSIKNKTVA